MRTTLVSMLAVLAQWAIIANAQPQAGALPAWPAATNGNWAHPSTKRLFFFVGSRTVGQPALFGRPSDPNNIGRSAVFGRPAQSPDTGGFLRPYSIPETFSPISVHPTLIFPPTGLLPLESLPPQDLWRFFRPKNSRLFYFPKP